MLIFLISIMSSISLKIQIYPQQKVHFEVFPAGNFGCNRVEGVVQQSDEIQSLQIRVQNQGTLYQISFQEHPQGLYSIIAKGQNHINCRDYYHLNDQQSLITKIYIPKDQSGSFIALLQLYNQRSLSLLNAFRLNQDQSIYCLTSYLQPNCHGSSWKKIPQANAQLITIDQVVLFYQLKDSNYLIFVSDNSQGFKQNSISFLQAQFGVRIYKSGQTYPMKSIRNPIYGQNIEESKQFLSYLCFCLRNNKSVYFQSLWLQQYLHEIDPRMPQKMQTLPSSFYCDALFQYIK